MKFILILFLINFIFALKAQESRSTEDRSREDTSERENSVDDVSKDDDSTKTRKMGIISDRLIRELPIEEDDSIKNRRTGIISDRLIRELPVEKVIEEPVEEVVEEVIEEIVEAKPVVFPPVDILFVIDNSKSMNYILKSIDQRLSTFLETLSAIDWRIVFIPAEVTKRADDILIPLEYHGHILDQFFLQRDQEHYREIFIDTLTRSETKPCRWPPYCGKLKERPLGALEKFFIFDQSYEILRDEADVAVVILTDNMENKDSRKRFTQPEHIVSLFFNMYPEKQMHVYTLTVMTPYCEQEVRSQQSFFKEGNNAPLILRMGIITKGKNFDLCLDSYNIVGESIVQSFDNEFEN